MGVNRLYINVLLETPLDNITNAIVCKADKVVEITMRIQGD